VIIAGTSNKDDHLHSDYDQPLPTMSAPTTPNLLTLLPPSPSGSSSSLTSDEDTFDPSAPPYDATTPRPSALGIREIAKLTAARKAMMKHRDSGQGQPGVGTRVQAGPSNGSEIQLLQATGQVDRVENLPFAKQVEVKGWKVVGGRDWDSMARVGAYVGMLVGD
jgi:hypothetical protein